MREPTFHQVLVGAGPGDAITGMAVNIRDELRAIGTSGIFAHFVDPAIGHAVSHLSELPTGRPSDVLIYHSSYGNPEVTRALLRRPERLVLVYHNITPSAFVIDTDPAFAAGLEWGRHELRLLCGRSDLTIAVSQFNARELAELGFADVAVIPAGVSPERLLAVAPDTTTARVLREQISGPFVLGVSQLLPHKHQEILVQALHLAQCIHGLDLGLVLVGPARSASFERGLHQLARGLRVRNVWFAGRQSDSGLATLYRSARMFASASMHEGFGIPPLESMAFGVPAIVRDAGATSETVARGALMLPFESGPAMFAEAMAAVHCDDALRAELIRRGFDRVTELRRDSATSSFRDLLTSAGLTP